MENTDAVPAFGGETENGAAASQITEAEQNLKEETAAAAVLSKDEQPSSAPESDGGNFLPYKKRSGFKYGCYLLVKRLFDFFAGLIVFIILSPIILILLLVKWLEDFKNPVYVSKRVGKNGKQFRLFKIRTMRVGAETEKEELEKRGLNEADGPVFKMKNDPRITRVGRFYRKFSLDELLQLLNIINGTMSVVGPRPPIPKEVEQYTEEQKHRLDVKGGLLCLWQVQKNRHNITFNQWIRLDLEYITRQSVWLDIKIIFKGAYMVLFDHSGE